MTLKLGNKRFWLAMIATAAIVVGFRELVLVVCTWLGIPTAANIVGLVSLFIVLVGVRMSVGLPAWLSSSASTLLVDSGFAFYQSQQVQGFCCLGLARICCQSRRPL